MKNVVIQVDSTAIENYQSYQKLAEKIMKFKEDTNSKNIYVVISGALDDRRRQKDCLEYKYDTNKLGRYIDGKVDYQEANNPFVSSVLMQADLKSAMRLQMNIPDCTSLDPTDEDFPIVANSSYVNGKVDYEATCNRAENLNQYEGIVIIPGFGGIDKKNNMVKLGRKSGSVVASVIAQLSGAEYLIQINSMNDWSGPFVHSYDPDIPKADLELPIGPIPSHDLDTKIMDLYLSTNNPINVSIKDMVEQRYGVGSLQEFQIPYQ